SPTPHLPYSPSPLLPISPTPYLPYYLSPLLPISPTPHLPYSPSHHLITPMLPDLILDVSKRKTGFIGVITAKKYSYIKSG
ncbi:MAG: hypothetical protein F6K39_30730, partial [Okeania sp. SIO3B3]|nr:hypothetical protein [Okeania sp. SIO3B3]